MSEKRILLADDLMNPSEDNNLRSHLIRDLSAELCRRLGLPLEILYVTNGRNSLLPRALTSKMKARDKAVFSQLKEEMSHYPVKTKFKSAAGDPVSIILDRQSEDRKILMIVMGTHGRRGLSRAILGSVAEEIVRNSSKPVLIFGPEAQARKFELPMDSPLKILLLTDLSEASQHAEDFAFTLSAQLEADLTICHSVGDRIHAFNEMITAKGFKKGLSVKSIIEKMRSQSDRELKQKARQAEKANINTVELLIKSEGSIAQVFSKELSGNFDLVIMGTRGRGKFLTSFVGSSARQIILSSPVPVIICKS